MGLLPIQTQAMLVYGNGVIIGNTTLTLASFKDIDGNLISMQGTTMTGTIEPNGGVQEEQIIFTGVTQNANGTATLTGVSSVAWASPYTQTSGFLKNHAGNTTFVLSDTAYLYSQYANLGGTNTFTGTDTFNISPIIPTVSSSQTTQAASVGYVNSVSVGAGAVKASNTVFGISELSVAPVTASVPIAVGQNDPILPTQTETNALIGDGGTPSATNTYVTQRGSQIGSESFAVTGGTSTAYTLAMTPSTTGLGYIKGERIYFQTNVASGASPTINKDSNGAKSLYKQTTTGTTALAVGDLGTNQMNVAEYDGGAFQLLSPTAPMTSFNGLFKNGTTTQSGAGTQNIAHGLGTTPKFIRITVIENSAGSPGNGSMSFGTYNGTTVSCVYAGFNAAGSYTNNGLIGVDTTHIARAYDNNQSNGITAIPTFDGTNITLTWSAVGSPAGTAQIMWEAQA